MENLKENIIYIKDLIGSKYPSFHKEGLQLQKILKNAILNQKTILVSFDGVKRCATQFLNASFGVIYIDYPESEIQKYIQINFADVSNLKDKLELVKKNALMSEEYDAIVHEAY